MIDGERPNRARRATPAFRAAALGIAALIAIETPVHAQRGGLPLIRDAEIEQVLREYSQPILRAAGLAKQNIRVVIINDRAFNAFVADGRRIFVNAGALMDAQTPNQVIGVLAHETGHISGGHLARMRQEISSASTIAILAMLLGAGAMIAGAGSAGSAGSQIGAAAIQAPQSVIQRSLLAYQRAHEDQADRAGVTFLNATGQSARGMSETFKRLGDQVLYTARSADPYLQSHPMPSDRVAALQELAKSSPYWDKKDAPELQARHDLMRAKLHGFIERPDTVLRRYPMSDTSLPARYARAITAYRYGDPRSALAQVDSLIQSQPGNPYFHELKGQALLEAGHPADAVGPLRRAVQLAPNPALIRVMLGQALIATNSPANAEEAVGILKSAMAQESETPELYAQLALAYGKKGNLAEADLASAQAASMRGDIGTARTIAARAKGRFPVGSPGWVKADDITSLKPLGRN